MININSAGTEMDVLQEFEKQFGHFHTTIKDKIKALIISSNKREYERGRREAVEEVMGIVESLPFVSHAMSSTELGKYIRMDHLQEKLKEIK